MKTQDLIKARELLADALAHPTTMGKDYYINEALKWMKKTVTKQPVERNTTTPEFKAAVRAYLANNPESELQDEEIARLCGATTGTAAGRVSEIRNGVL